MTVELRIRPNGPAIQNGRVFDNERFRCEVVRGGSVQMIAFAATPDESERKARLLCRQQRLTGPLRVVDQTCVAPLADADFDDG